MFISGIVAPHGPFNALIVKDRLFMELKKEAVQVIYRDNKIVGVVHFVSDCRHRVFYETNEMGEDELSVIFSNNEEKEIKTL